MSHTPKSVATSIGGLADRIKELTSKASLKSSDQRQFNAVADDLKSLASELEVQDERESEGNDDDGNNLSPLTGGTGAALEGVAPVNDPAPAGSDAAKKEDGGIPTHAPEDPQRNITTVGTVEGNQDPQIPALITPPGEPFPEPAVIVVKEGDSPFDPVKQDGSIESAPAPEEKPE